MCFASQSEICVVNTHCAVVKIFFAPKKLSTTPQYLSTPWVMNSRNPSSP